MTTCADDEYRCHYGGQCIPLIFTRDGHDTTHYLDGSEGRRYLPPYMLVINSFCGKIIAFQCEERIDRYPLSFSCGDGQFLPMTDLPTGSLRCSNLQHKQATLAMLTSLDHLKDIKCQQAFRFLLLTNRSYGNNAMSCENSTYFYCNQSLKCISYHRVGDGFVDCYYGEDEHFSTCRLNVSNRFICQSEPTKSLSPVVIWNGLDYCPKGEDETAESMHIWD
ncbi:unnamed protein product [Rotaria magnacalcarata]|uniref:Uncharacterized protein n=1 Tax=Rotaria magnacalcarata TaxID=392030 RepID=A0A814TAS3_9BILA|nr:unnamed protein product [Rotaria magnacalcarata]CAF3859584.1 unnamed protein product [Rotaria magnacalcarata]